MESKWRSNVWEIGAWGDEYSLVASIPGLNGFWIAGTPKGVPYYRVIFHNPHSGEAYEELLTAEKGISNPHFPYGNTVDPD